MKKVSVLTLKILSDLNEQELDSAISRIQNRDRLINIIIQVHRVIEVQFKELKKCDASEKDYYEAWLKDVERWSQEQSSSNDKIEELLLNEKENTSREIASIFDKKSRHKGYDLTNVK